MAYVVMAKWTAKADEVDAVAAAISRMVGPTLAEPGNLGYEVLRDPEDERVFLLYEKYVDADAYAAHGASEHFQRNAVQDGIPRLESRERRFYETWDPA